MHAIIISDNKLELSQQSIPQPQAGEILVKVEYAGVNRADLLQLRGLYPLPTRGIPGLEIAGTIQQLGDGVKGFTVNQPICALIQEGGYAEYAICRQELAFSIPDNLSTEQAAGLPEALFTVWLNLYDKLQLKRGDNILIHGGASGIGTMAIQIAKQYFSAKVVTTASTEAKRSACIALGADKALDHNAPIEQKFDAVLDMFGGPNLQSNIDLLAYKGKLAIIAFIKGSKGEIDLAKLVRQNLTITGSTLRDQHLEIKKKLASDLRSNIWPLIVSEKIKPMIDRVFPLSEASQAHDHLKANMHIGKIVLKL
jgi:putative PIG3 family NAD(P)H quinone oxidoreductase